VRGDGLLLVLACEKEVMPIIHACREQGLLVLAAGPHVLRFLPALNITAAEIEEGLTLLNKSIEGLDL